MKEKDPKAIINHAYDYFSQQHYPWFYVSILDLEIE